MINVDLKSGDLAVVSFQAHTISPSRQISEADLGVKISTLPEALKAYTRGRFLSSDRLKGFTAIRKAVTDYLWEHSVRFPLGYAVDPRSAVEVHRKMADLKCKYDDAAKKLIAEYAEACEEMEAEVREELSGEDFCTAFVEAIKRNRPTVDDLEAAITFEFQLSHVGEVRPVDGATDPALDELATGTRAMRASLFHNLLSEVVQHIRGIIGDNKLDNPKEKIRRSTVERAKKVLDKLDRLVWVSNKVRPARALLQQAFDLIPDVKVLEGRDAENFRRLLMVLADKAHVIYCAENGEPFFTLDASASKAKDETPQEAQQVATTEAPAKVAATPESVAPRKRAGRFA